MFFICVAVSVNPVSLLLLLLSEYHSTLPEQNSLLSYLYNLHLPLSCHSLNETLYQTLIVCVHLSLSFVTASSFIFVSSNLICPLHLRFFSYLHKCFIHILLLFWRWRIKGEAEHFRRPLYFHTEAYYFLICLSICHSRMSAVVCCWIIQTDPQSDNKLISNLLT